MKGIKLKVWKEGKRLLSMALCAALIGGTLAGAAVPAVDVQAAMTEAEVDGKTVYEYDFADIDFSGTPTVTKDAPEAGAATVVFGESGATYVSTFGAIPGEVDVAGLETIEIVTHDSNTGAEGNICLKVFKPSDDMWGDGSKVQYDSFKIDCSAISGRKDLNQFAIMAKAGGTEYVFSKIKFTCGEPAEEEESEEKSQTFDFATLEKFNNGEEGMLNYSEDTEAGTTTIKYGKIYQSLFVKIPDSVDVKNLKQVIFEVDKPGDLGYKLYTNAKFESDKHNGDAAVSYGNPNLSASGVQDKADLGYVVVMSMVDSTEVVVSKVTFITSEAKPKTNEYTFNDVDTYADANVEASVSENGAIVLEFDNEQYATALFSIPRNVNKETLTQVEFDVESIQTVSENGTVSDNSIYNFAFKICTEDQKNNGGQAGASWNNPQLPNGITGFEGIYAETEDSLDYVGVMLTGVDSLLEGQKVRMVIKGIKFSFMPSGLEDRFIEEEVASLYEKVKADSGISMGVAVPVNALDEPERMKLVYKHYDSLTCENEMKPEGILGGEPKDVNEDGKVTVDDIQLNFGNADKVMDAVVSANNAGVANIKVRGHVFVWHSQTPTWFFREGFSANGDYVTPEVMDTRMEWYIKSVAEHFDTEYEGLIYAWDVVNEAANDGGGPRTNGDWYGVYQDWSFIPKAFKFADQYLAEDTILFYNDYNECTPTKRDQIVEFLEEIRKHISEDRKLGAGMQGHHDMATPTLEMIEEAVRAYAAAADVVHITELDIKSTMGYVDSPEARVVEYTQQGHRYKEIYNMIKRVNAETGNKVTNITIWGTDDRNSWLKTSNSVGGSADGKTPQFPLLFDEDLKVKPAYWAFVDQSKLEPAINSVNAMNTDDAKYASENVAKKADGTAWFKFKSYWADNKLYFQVDETVSENNVVLYTDIDENGEPEGPVPFENGVASVEVKDLGVKQTYLFDIVVDGDAYNDTKGSYTTTSKYYAKVTTKPLMQLAKGTAYVDGDVSDWKDVEGVEFTEKMDNPEANVEAKVCWDEENLYVLMDVEDANLDATSGQVHEKDSMEVFIDELNEKAGGYDDNDKQYRVNYLNEQSFNGATAAEENIDSVVQLTEDGYVIEAAIKWTALEAKPGELIGLDLQINDGKGGTRIGTRNWYDTSGNGWQNPGVFGTAVLVDAVEASEEDVALATAADDAAKAIGTVAYTAACKEKIDAAVAAYADMTVAQRLLVAKDTLTAIKLAETLYAKMDDEVKAAQEAIAAIGKVAYTEDSLKAIEAAKEACKGLNDDQKAAMKSALDTLAAAEKSYESAKAEYLANEENKKNDAAAVKKVTDLIKAIGTVSYDATVKAKIDEARKAYDALTQAQKDQIPADVLKVLTDAETTYKAAEEEATKVEYFAKFSVKSIPLKVGQKSKALAKDIQIAKGDKIVKWTTSNKKVVTVDKKGTIKGKKAGTAKITAYTESGLKASIKVKVQKKKVAPIKITLTNKSTKKAIKSKGTVTLKKGKKLTVVANVKPMTCTEKVKFTSSNKKVAKVSSKGVITAKKKGTATITAKVGKKSFKFKVKVK